MNNTKVAGGLAAAIIGIPVAVGLFGGGSGADDPHGQKETTVEQTGDTDPTAESHAADTGDKAELASTVPAADEGESTETANSDSETSSTTEAEGSTTAEATDQAPAASGTSAETDSAATDDKTDEGEAAETETAATEDKTGEAETAAAADSGTETASTEAEATDQTDDSKSEQTAAATDDKTDEGESAETAAVTDTPLLDSEPKADEDESTETVAADPASTEIAQGSTPAEATDQTTSSNSDETQAAADSKTDEGESAETETAAVTYTPPPPTETEEDDAQFEDTTGETASGGAIQLAMNAASEPKSASDPEPEAKAEIPSSATSVGKQLAGLDGLTSGTAYAVARTGLLQAGWSPRELTDAERLDALDEKEQTLVASGFVELEGCETYARMVCRFEFLNDDGKIAAILTSGDDVPTVIDAYVMDVE